MKKFFFTMAVILLVSLPMSAQIRFGVKAGANVTGLSFKGEGDFRDKNVTGFQIGPMVEFLINGGFGLDAGVMFAQKGIKFQDGKIDEKMGYIDVPVNLKYMLTISDNIKPFATAGPYISFKVSGDDNFGEIQDDWKTKNFGAGLNFGLGVELAKFLQLSGGYQLSLSDNYQTSQDLNDFSAKSHVWSVNAAILF